MSDYPESVDFVDFCLFLQREIFLFEFLYVNKKSIDIQICIHVFQSRDGLVGYDARFTRGRSRVRFPLTVQLFGLH